MVIRGRPFSPWFTQRPSKLAVLLLLCFVGLVEGIHTTSTRHIRDAKWGTYVKTEMQQTVRRRGFCLHMYILEQLEGAG